ncbi:MAG: patatin-like phospholipase family protein [Bacteroidaceae bacterium]|nr:patatin-like phospholipase family protein [Bacteroidaceae bacterium]
MAKSKKYQTGFVLSGGFIKGFAHLGAIQALIERDIRPQIISSTSAGSLVGALYADGNEPYQVLEFFDGLTFTDLTKPVLPTTGFFELAELQEFLQVHLKRKRIELLPVPMVITATDLDNGRLVYFRRGDIAQCVAASCCMPVLFSPVVIDNTHFVDGGVLMNLPVSPIREECECIYAINVSPLLTPDYKKNIISIAERSYQFIFRSNTFPEREMADVLIEPVNLSGYSNLDLDRSREIFMAGYNTANEILSQTPLLSPSN